jgi:hypothetical protein
VKPIPWDSQCGEYQVSRGSIRISTTRILRNLVTDLRSTGFQDLGDELESTHIDRVAPVRHACAHAAFLCPNEDGRDNWVFGDYVSDGSGGMRTEEISMTSAEFGALCASFFNFRFGFLSALGSRKDSLRPIEAHFSAENQCTKGEMLDCQFKDGNLAIKVKGRPLW